MAWSKSALGNWHKFRRLSGAERWLLLQALLLLPLTAQMLRWVGVRRWQSFLARLSQVKRIAGDTGYDSLIRRARLTARMVRVAAGHVPCRATCLYQSLTLWWLLRRQGVASDLRIGVGLKEGQFLAHAWVEFQGRVLTDAADVRQRFTAFDRAIEP
jgi:hypothetical protein